jgi:ketosteroid isomerase-like protein
LNAVTNKQVVQEFGAAIFNNLLGADTDLGRFLLEDVVWWLPQSSEELGVPQKYEGKSDVLAMLSGAASNFYIPDSMEFDYHSCIAEGDRVATHFTLRAKTVNGKNYENHYQTLYRCQDGLIAEVWEYFDTAYLRSVFSE